MKNLWTRNQGEHISRNIDRWSDPPSGTLWAKWFGGGIIPLLILWPAFNVILTQTGFLLRQAGMRMDLHGTDAVLLGSAMVFLALFCHTHYFWGNSRRLFPFYDLGKTISLLGFCFCAVWLIIRLFKSAFDV